MAPIALGAAMMAGAAHAVPLACWTYELVPGQRVPHAGLDLIQDGHTYYSDEFDWRGEVDQDALAEMFEAHVRKTVPRRSGGSVYLSGCVGNSSSGSAQSNASRAHDRRFRESSDRTTNLHWTPSAADLAKAPPPRGPTTPIYMQCLTAPHTPQINVPAVLQTSPVFQVKAADSYDLQQQFRDYAAKNLNDAPKCLVARTPDRLKAMLIDEIDHYGLGSRIVEAPFKPITALASPKPTPTPTPTPMPKAAQTASLTVKADTSAKDAARAWDEQVKKTLAAEAQKKVEAAAKAAQADAKRQAEIAAFFAERRKQGRAQ